ncbi:tetratricopeptide repeat protein [Fibrella sp. ES10-3-2-2]|nr:histidine kinase [Fibrella sp. ES10-3-2-2]
MKVFKLLVLTCFWYQGAVAQQSLTDSLKQRLNQPLADTSRVLLLDQLGRSLMYSKTVEAMQFAQDGLSIAQAVGYQRGEARILNRMGTIYRLTGNYAKALDAHLKSIQVAQAIDDKDALARTYNNIGVLYSERKDSRKAIEYFQKTRALADQLGNTDLSRIALSNIGSDYALLNQLDSALAYTRTAYDLTRKQKADDIQIELINLGNIYKRMGRYPLALSFYQKSIATSVSMKDDRTLSQTYVEMAEVFQKLNRADSAILYAGRSLRLAQTANIPVNVLQAGKLLSELTERSNPEQALASFKLAATAKDSLESAEKVRNFQNIEFNEKMRQQDIDQAEAAYRGKITTYILLGLISVFVTIALLLYRTNRSKQRANVQLQRQRDEISIQRHKAEDALSQLTATQAQLIQKEKLASLGELTAGIAHEIQNPLNFVNNFSEICSELVDELKTDIEEGRTGELLALATDLSLNLSKITHHGKRAEAIVKGMLAHSRHATGEKAPTNLNTLANEYLTIAYQGQLAKDKDVYCKLVTHFAPGLNKIDMVGPDIGRVLLNLYTNAVYAVQERAKRTQSDAGYEPTITVSTLARNGMVELRMADNGSGIPDGVLQKIFQPFFTTKPTGEGTGLGLSLSYDIITKGHGGEMTVTSREGEGTEFVIRLPARHQATG